MEQCRGGGGRDRNWIGRLGVAGLTHSRRSVSLADLPASERSLSQMREFSSGGRGNFWGTSEARIYKRRMRKKLTDLKFKRMQNNERNKNKTKKIERKMRSKRNKINLRTLMSCIMRRELLK